MSTVPGLPAKGSDVTVLITKVHLHPLSMLVEFWGKFSHDKTSEYQCLAKDIQSPGSLFQDGEGNPGDQCLAEIDGIWHRSRIVSRNGFKYSIYLIDKGMTYNSSTSKLAWPKKNHFHLPPEVEFCLLANVLPISSENRWTPVALEFLKSFSGKSVKAHVQEVLVAQRTFLLHIPSISCEMYEMGIAKKLPPDSFQDVVLKSLQSPTEAAVTHQISRAPEERYYNQDAFIYPELPVGSVETVIVTELTSPQRIFCQLKVFSLELKKLSQQITQCYEDRVTNSIVGPEMIGSPCAARGSDGRWYRSVLQQVFPAKKVAEVFCVDYGMKQIIHLENIRPLAAEFLRMPVVTYICSLYGILDKGVGWTPSQIGYLTTLLLHKTAIAKFEYHSVSEGVYYVTVYGSENTNINKLFGSEESCLLECEKVLGRYAIGSACGHQDPSPQDRNQRKTLPPGQAGEERVRELVAEDLCVNSSYLAAVQYVSDPSEFWIQTERHAKEFDDMMDSICYLYKDTGNNEVIRNPPVGLYCVAKAKCGDFCRATVVEVGERQIKVFFVDYGNTELVDRNDIRTLPDELKKLPCLALKCALAGGRPKHGRWSQSACEFFIKAVTDKSLLVHVTAKHNDGYTVHLTDTKAWGERDLSTMMCRLGFTERDEKQSQPNAKMTMNASAQPPPQLLASFSAAHSNKGASPQTLRPNGGISGFKEQMFPIGSTLDVCVSYMENPNDFWCQLVQTAGHLKLLMHDIQAHYADSEFQPFQDVACVARHPANGMWYRALIIRKCEMFQVEVLFVDYGQLETVSLFDLRMMSPEFLILPGQAFRCSLLNPVNPISATNEWSKEAVARFRSFVETAASNCVILKCTVYAVMYSEQKIVFNVVDLETPFESISTSLANLAKTVHNKKSVGFRLDTYYYSPHNIKTGSEEQVTVVCVKSIGEFYCQLERNSDVIKDLKTKVNNLCHQLENVSPPSVFGSLCFAKYADGEWYRGQIKKTKPQIVVHFVDYGDTIEVKRADLLPVPKEAGDIMSVPVQAILCCLSDVPDNVSSEVNSWFEMRATACQFRALVVAREPDGKLEVELYHGKTQMNSEIKKRFKIEMQTEQQVVFQGWRSSETSANQAQKTPKDMPPHTVENKNQTLFIKKSPTFQKPAHQIRDVGMYCQSPQQTLCQVGADVQRFKPSPLELYKPPQQRKCEGLKPTSPSTDLKKESNTEKLPKLEDLPTKSITSGMEADIYVSHYNSPLSFYVQLVREEGDLISVVEKLNSSQTVPQAESIKGVRPGDLVQAEFADDFSWYRAVVRKINQDATVLVEFIDFGNTAVIPLSKMVRLPESVLKLPMYSIHCMLSDAVAQGKEEVADPSVNSVLRDICVIGEKMLKCQFIKPSGSMWEVGLEDDGLKVAGSADTAEITSEKLESAEETHTCNSDIRQMAEKSPQNLCSLCYQQQEFSRGQKMDAYVTTITDIQTFWCQPDSQEFEEMILKVSEQGNAVGLKHPDPSVLSPGSPCLALFSDDQQWYRAEVISRDGDVLSVFFVDYGNTAQVSTTDVKEITADLIETPSGAFLCELEGFDASHGSWDSGAEDEFSVLTMDKVLQLTVSQVIKEEGKIRYLVQMECEGHVINETMKTWWKSFTAESNQDEVEATTLSQTPPMCDSEVTEITLPKDEVEDTRSMTDTESFAEERDQILSECSVTTEPEMVILEETDSDLVPTQCENVSSDQNGTEEASLSPNKDEQGDLRMSLDKSAAETDPGIEEDTNSVTDTAQQQEPNSPVEEHAEATVNKAKVETSVPGELNTDSMETSLNIMNSTDQSEQRVAKSVPTVNSKRTVVKMVPCEAIGTGVCIDPQVIKQIHEVQNESEHPCRECPEEQSAGPVYAALVSEAEPQAGPDVCDLTEEKTSLEGNTCPVEDKPCPDEDICPIEDKPCPDEDICPVEDKPCPDEDICPVEDKPCPDEDICPVEDKPCPDEDICPVEDKPCPDEDICPIEDKFCPDEDICPVEDKPCPDEDICPIEDKPCPDEDDICPVEDKPCPDEDICPVEDKPCTDEDNICPDEDKPCPDEDICPDEDKPCTDEDTCPDEDKPCPDEDTCPDGEETCPDEDKPCTDEDLCPDGEETCPVEDKPCPEEDICPDGEETCPDEDKPCPEEDICPDGEETCPDEDKPCPEEDICPVEDKPCTDEDICPDGEETCPVEDKPCTDEDICPDGEETCPVEDKPCTEEDICPDEDKPCPDGETSLTDVCSDTEKGGEGEEAAESEELEYTTIEEDSASSLLMELMASSDDDDAALDAQLKVTHLSLVVVDGSDDLPAHEQKPEE